MDPSKDPQELQEQVLFMLKHVKPLEGVLARRVHKNIIVGEVDHVGVDALEQVVKNI